MIAMFDRQQLEKLLKDFYTLTNVRVAMLNEQGIEAFSYPLDLPDFCKLIRTDPAAKQACLTCDKQACEKSAKSREAMIYQCHAGLTEVITQIRVNDVQAGYLLLGHVQNAPDRAESWKQVQQCCEKYDLPLDELQQAYHQLPYTPHEVLTSAAHILQIAAAYLCESDVALLVPGSLVDRINNYIAEHLDGDLSSIALCEKFCISRTALYHIAIENYGCGIAEYISQLRIHKAVQLLIGSDMSNSEIAHTIGFRDYNYFSKRFRQETGFSPREYRKRFETYFDKQLKL